MSFSKKREIIQYSYSIDDKCILRVSSLRDLGVYFDTTLRLAAMSPILPVMHLDYLE